MNKTALIACVALTAATAAPAFAGSADRATSASQEPIRVQLCDVDALSQPAFRQVDGARPVFVTADEVLAARASGQRWDTTRCMNAVQHQQLTNALRERVVYRAEARPRATVKPDVSGQRKGRGHRWPRPLSLLATAYWVAAPSPM